MIGFHQTLITLFVIFTSLACAKSRDEPPSGDSAQTPSPADFPDTMASFARMIGGEWKMTVQSGHSLYDKWHWGPGHWSVRLMTDGHSAAGDPWHELEIFYWHPRQKQVRMLTMHPDVPGIGRGVGEGFIKFEGDTANGTFNLWQPGSRRSMGLLWAFDTPDKYHEVLLESTGPGGLKPLAEWDHVRIKSRNQPQPAVSTDVLKPASYFKNFESLLGYIWEANADLSSGDAFQMQTTLDWIPYAEAIYLRTLAVREEDATAHLLDAYIYHHVGLDALRCLALSNWGGVFEGGVTVLADGALRFDLSGSEENRAVRFIIQFDFEQSGTMRQRVWSVTGAERSLAWDVRHQKISAK